MTSQSLSGAAWRFRDATKNSRWRAAEVPGCVHLDLRRHELIPDPFWSTNENDLQWIEERDWEYRTDFHAPPELMREEVVDLVADGLDTLATVTVNGEVVARTENMFTGYRWDIRALLKNGKNELAIRFGSAADYIRCTRTAHVPRELNDPVGRCVVIRKEQCQFGWDWGPRFVTAGIWRDIRLEAWSGNRLDSIRVKQEHGKNRAVTLRLEAELARPDAAATLHWTLSLDGRRVGEGQGSEIAVKSPQLWWPNGQGAQPLYDLSVDVRGANGTTVGTWHRRIGLRTIELDRHKDEWGESFQFLVNGRAIFAKGANWIPAHSFVANLTRADYARDLESAAMANMNMIRIWGGGIYESEDFYDLCDELGLLVWQDFMFACTLYPADAAFLESSRQEAVFQAKRLRHRASLALWCGNNEVFGCNAHEFGPEPKKYADYEALFHRMLPDALRTVDAVTPYWPSSPWRGDTGADHAAGVQRGDTHFWDVWHARQPVKDYEKYVFRFVSEFGMQSFSSPETNATFCPPDADNVFGPEMENHQKNRFGNQIILDYVSRLYRFPKGQDELIYLSQLNQAYCMQVGVEHWRRNSPRCMGALYWQLNDCWPVASWSSIEFTGRWRALHHVARRFFAPALAVAHMPGEELTIIGNYRRSTIHEVHLSTIYDAPASAKGSLEWELMRMDGRRLLRGKKTVALRPGESKEQQTLELGPLIEKHGRSQVYLRIALIVGGKPASEDTVFFTSPRFMELPRARTTVKMKRISPRQTQLTFSSPVFQHRFAFELAGLPHRSTDNYFDLYPGRVKSVVIDTEQTVPMTRLKQALTWRSLVDSY